MNVFNRGSEYIEKDIIYLISYNTEKENGFLFKKKLKI